MAFWLLKSEPDEFSIEALERLPQSRWDGVRNYQARNFIRAMQPDDLFFFYHSSCAEPGVAGIGRIVSEAYPDPLALLAQSPYFDAKATAQHNPWSAIDVAFVQRFSRVLALRRLKAEPALANLELLRKGSRLSVMPVTPAEWKTIVALAEG